MHHWPKRVMLSAISTEKYLPYWSPIIPYVEFDNSLTTTSSEYTLSQSGPLSVPSSIILSLSSLYSVLFLRSSVIARFMTEGSLRKYVGLTIPDFLKLLSVPGLIMQSGAGLYTIESYPILDVLIIEGYRDL